MKGSEEGIGEREEKPEAKGASRGVSDWRGRELRRSMQSVDRNWTVKRRREEIAERRGWRHEPHVCKTRNYSWELCLIPCIRTTSFIEPLTILHTKYLSSMSLQWTLTTSLRIYIQSFCLHCYPYYTINHLHAGIIAGSSL